MSDFISVDDIYLDSPVTTRDELLRLVAEEAKCAGYTDDAQLVKAAFDAREDEGTTGMMDGFAIPHAKSSAITQAAVMVVRAIDPIKDWPSMDKKPISVAIALLVPDNEAGSTHLKLLSKVAVMLMDENFRKDVLTASDEVTIAQLINSRLDL